MVNSFPRIQNRIPTHWRIALALFLIVAGVFAQTVSFDFVNFDDPQHLQENPAVAHFGREGLEKIWSAPYFGLYIPVTYTLWGAQFKLAQSVSSSGNELTQTASPGVFHATNVFFHALNAVLVFYLLLQLELGLAGAVLGALVFALHPVQVESVAWISSFRDLLAAFWGLLFLNLLFKPETKTWWPRAAGLLILLLLAMLSKPSAVIFAGLAPLLWFLKEKKWQFSKRIFFGLGLILAVACAVIAKQAQPESSVDISPEWWERLFLATHALAFYAGKILWPVNLTPDYGFSSAALLKDWNSLGFPLGEIIAVIVSVGIIFYFTLKKKWLAAGLFLAIFVLLPYSGLVSFNYQNISLLADRYLYLSMLGLGISVASLWTRLPSILWQRIAGIGFAGGLIVWAGLSIQQSQYWRGDDSLFPRMAELNDHSFYAYGWMGRVALDQGHYADAEKFLSKAVEIRPSFQFARQNLARAFTAEGNFPEALKNFIRVINTDPKFIPAYRDLAVLLIGKQRFPEADQVIQHGLSLAPNSADLYSVRGDLAQAQSEVEEALTYYLRAVTLDPGHYLAHESLGLLYAKSQLRTQAAEQIEICYRIDPPRAAREKLRQKIGLSDK